MVSKYKNQSTYDIAMSPKAFQRSLQTKIDDKFLKVIGQMMKVLGFQGCF